MAQLNGKLKGIIFDKDGTLFDYAQVWEDVLKENIELSFEAMGKSSKVKAKQAMLHLMGIDNEGACHPKGLVFTHRKVQIFRRFLLYCFRYRINVIKAMRAYHHSVQHSEVLLSRKLKTMDFSLQQRLFAHLKEQGMKIGVITNDNASSTSLFLSLMGIEQYVDFVASRDSRFKHKPNPEAFLHFCNLYDLQPRQVAMVGDTITDMLFAKQAKAGYTIALLSGSNDVRSLSALADVVYPDISHLLNDPHLSEC